MKNINEEGKTFNERGNIFRRPVRLSVRGRPRVTAHGFAPKVVFFTLYGFFVSKVAPFIYQNHYLCSRNTKTSLKSYTYYILYGAEYV